MTAAQLYHTLVHTRRQRAMAVFLTGDGAAFLTLFTVYLYLRIQAAEWPTALHFASGVMGFSMTLFAVSSTFTMAAAARQQEKGDTVHTPKLIGISVATWLTFLFLAAMEWARLVLFEKVTLSSPFGATFFALSGYHALHVVIGCFYMIAVAARIEESDVGACALFVHFSNAMWLMAYAGLYITNTDLQGL